MKRWYVGLKDGKRETFTAAAEPTEQTHGGRFAAVIGPFRTKIGAEFMRDHGANNPHCLTVSDAEWCAVSRR